MATPTAIAINGIEFVPFRKLLRLSIVGLCISKPREVIALFYIISGVLFVLITLTIVAKGGRSR